MTFPADLTAIYGLEVGTRLLTVNTYREGSLAEDLEPGPQSYDVYGDFSPLIAEFLSGDLESIEARKEGIDEEEWARTLEQGRAKLEASGPGSSRDGRPTKVHALPSLGVLLERTPNEILASLAFGAVLGGVLGHRLYEVPARSGWVSSGR